LFVTVAGARERDASVAGRPLGKAVERWVVREAALRTWGLGSFRAKMRRARASRSRIELGGSARSARQRVRVLVLALTHLPASAPTPPGQNHETPAVTLPAPPRR